MRRRGRLLQHLQASQWLLKDLATGRLFAPCAACNGTGRMPNVFDWPCDDCEGLGTTGLSLDQKRGAVRHRPMRQHRTVEPMDERQRLQQAFIDAGLALLRGTGAATVCAPVQPDLWIAIGSPESICRMLPDKAANDELQPPAGN